MGLLRAARQNEQGRVAPPESAIGMLFRFNNLLRGTVALSFLLTYWIQHHLEDQWLIYWPVVQDILKEFLT